MPGRRRALRTTRPDAVTSCGPPDRAVARPRSPRGVRLLAPALAAGGALASPAPAAAHGFGTAGDLPIPTWLFAWAAAAVLVVSFVVLAALWRRPVLGRLATGRTIACPAWILRVGQVVLGTFAVAVFAITVWAALAGAQTPAANPAPSLVFAVIWVGLPILAVLVGDVWRVLSPWGAIGRLCGVLVRPIVGEAAPLRWPERLGQWPAVLTVVGFVIVELLTSIPSDPFTLGVLLVLYAAVMLVGQSLFGVEAWSRNADGFAALSRIFGALAPLAIDDRRVRLRVPGSGTTELRPGPGSTGLALAVLSTTTFDGVTNTWIWGERPGLASLLGTIGESLGLSARGTIVLTGLIGMTAVTLIVVGLIGGAASAMRRTGRETASVGALVRAFSPTFVPIAWAYLVAHYWTFLVVQGQAAFALLSDPLATGADLFGTAGRAISYGIVQGTGVWYVQVVVLLAGHVMALVLAHDLALERSRGPRAAVRSQRPMLFVMIALTSLGLWLLSS